VWLHRLIVFVYFMIGICHAQGRLDSKDKTLSFLMKEVAPGFLLKKEDVDFAAQRIFNGHQILRRLLEASETFDLDEDYVDVQRTKDVVDLQWAVFDLSVKKYQGFEEGALRDGSFSFYFDLEMPSHGIPRICLKLQVSYGLFSMDLICWELMHWVR
jgi:hypothetical protein